MLDSAITQREGRSRENQNRCIGWVHFYEGIVPVTLVLMDRAKQNTKNERFPVSVFCGNQDQKSKLGTSVHPIRIKWVGLVLWSNELTKFTLTKELQKSLQKFGHTSFFNPQCSQ